MKNLSIFIVILCAFIAIAFRWLPADLRAPVTHSRWFRSVAAAFGPDTRVMIADNNFPWRSIGIVHGGRSDNWLCTGFLIGPRTVATSAHCVLDDDGRLRRRIRYSIVRQTHYGRLTYPAQAVRTHPFEDYDPVAMDNGDYGPSDMAMIELAEPIGDVVGYLGADLGETMSEGHHGSMADPEGVSGRELCGNSINRLPWQGRAVARAAPGGPDWMAPNPDDPPRICAAGYSGEVGNVRLSVANVCGLLGLVDGVVIHNCVIADGASGGPLFYLDRRGVPVAFATNTASIQSHPTYAAFGEDRLFVGTLFKEFIE